MGSLQQIHEIFVKHEQIVDMQDHSSGELRRGISAQGEDALTQGPYTVMDKNLTPPSGDKHDFLRMPTYAWPNPDTEDGLPYIIKDGQFGPHINGPDYDQGRMVQFTKTIKDLAWAYTVSQDERFAQRAIHLLNVWYLDDATKMNPNLNYSKFIPGMEAPFPTGVIATHHWVELVQAIGLLVTSKNCTESTYNGLRDWFGEYVVWLQNSHQGLSESQFENNRGIWYDVQIAAFARFSGNDDLARNAILASARQRLEQQIANDGSLPKELARTNGLTYSVMTLRAFMILGLIGEQIGADIFHHTAEDGRGLVLALDYLQPFVMNPQMWPHQQIRSEHVANKAAFVYAIAAYAYDKQSYRDVVLHAEPDHVEAMLAQSLFL